MAKKKKVVRKKKAKKTTKSDVDSMTTSDLYSMYMFVANDANNRGFGLTSPEARDIVRERLKEIEEELYFRAYGYNPFKEHKVVVSGTKPEDVDLDRFAVVKGPNKEPEDKKPETFVVAKNKE